MQFTIYINQEKAIEWGLNLQQATLFSFLYSVPSWGKTYVVNNGVYCSVGKSKVAEELPILSGKPDTIKRYFAQLEAKGLIERFATEQTAYFRLTEKAAAWNMTATDNVLDPGKKIPTPSGNKSRTPREKNPVNHITNNQNTNNHISLGATVPAAPKSKPAKTYSEEFEIAWSIYPIRDGSNPKNKAFANWNARLSEGVSLESLINGTKNYRAHCDAKGKTGSPYVMQATRFFGTEREFENLWSVNNDQQQNTGDGRGTSRRSLSAVERVALANGIDPTTGEFLDEQPINQFDDGAIDAEFWTHG